MRSTQTLLSLALLSVAAIGVPSGAVAAAAPVQRFLLVVGANAGGADRAKLQYAISDAERFARVMVELGGVLPANEVVLKQPRLKELIDALDALNTRVTNARRVRDAGRIEVVVYYSGHADEQGLLLDGDRYAYRTLRDWLDAIPADVRIAVLDACASGAFTRIKSGKIRPPFLVDESTAMRGHVFLTSSADTEVAQESDRIRASYFTHYLVSGFRGAADLSGDGKVTLNEAYQFAFNETLGRTVDTRAGAQHPSYDINLTGSGDVVMTDLRQTTATIVLPEDLEGRVFVRNSARELIAEVYKPAGRRVELGVEPGEYDVRLERQKASMAAQVRAADGKAAIVEARQFGPAALEPTRARGDQTRTPFAVDRRHRIDLLIGGAGAYGVGPAGGFSSSAAINVLTGLQYTMFAREDLGVTLGLAARGASASLAYINGDASFSDSRAFSISAGVKWNPFTSRHPGSRVKPFVGTTIGPVFASASETAVTGTSATTGDFVTTTVGGDLLAGTDIHIARWFSMTVTVGYNWMANFPRPIPTHEKFGGAEYGLSIGVLFGKGR